MKRIIMAAFSLLAGILLLWSKNSVSPQEEKYVIAYVTAWSDVMPDPQLMTHINYAFGHVTDSFDGIRIEKPERLRQIVALKERNPKLKVLLSVGGWTSGRFSEMAASDSTRQAFCLDARKIVDEFRLDGIDIDWEYPGSSEAGISSSEGDKDNFTKLMHGLRQTLGADKLVTLATYAGGRFYDFPAFIDAVDFVNMMSYDMNRVPEHHAPLFNSERFTGLTVEKALQAHLGQGVPARKLCMGLPLYGRGTPATADYVDFKDLPSQLGKFAPGYDAQACVPYLADSEGNLVLGYDDEESLRVKCRYALDKKLLGVMYWECGADAPSFTLMRMLHDLVIPQR